MNLSFQQINNLPVYTQSKQLIGKIGGLIIDVDAHIIKKYLVRKSSLVKELISALSQENDLEIHPRQVVSISQEKMVVFDNVARDIIGSEAKNKAAIAAPATLSQANEQ
jgi:sporulation protein YlmC with PRC-barrel domain